MEQDPASMSLQRSQPLVTYNTDRAICPSVPICYATGTHSSGNVFCLLVQSNPTKGYQAHLYWVSINIIPWLSRPEICKKTTSVSFAKSTCSAAKDPGIARYQSDQQRKDPGCLQTGGLVSAAFSSPHVVLDLYVAMKEIFCCRTSTACGGTVLWNV